MRDPYWLGVSKSLLCVLLATLCGSVAAQGLIWNNPWTTASAPSLADFYTNYYPGSTGLAFGANGDVLIAEHPLSPNFDLRIVRFTPAGAVRWSTSLPLLNLYDGSYDIPGALIANTDGGAFVTFGSHDYGYEETNVARIGADGSVLWSRYMPAWWVVVPSSETLVTAGCCSITALDAATGATVWQYEIPANTNGWQLSGGLAADSQGNVFATIPADNSFKAVKLSPAGTLDWTVDAGGAVSAIGFPAGIAPSMIGTSSGLLFLNAATGSLALHINDGTTAWTVPQSTIETLVGSPAEPVVTDPDGSLKRLAAATGQARWTQPLNTTPMFASVVGNRIFAETANGLLNIDSNTGAIAWSSTLPSQDANGDGLQFLAAGQRDSTTLMAVAKASNYYGAPPIFLQPVNMSNGQLLTQTAASPSPQGVLGSDSIVVDGGYIASTATVEDANGTNILVRRLDLNSGAQVWQTTEAIYPTPSWPGITTGAGRVIAVAAANSGSGYQNSNYNLTWAGAFDAQTGALQWQKSLGDYGQLYTYASEPVSDLAGNVYVGYGTYLPACDPWGCHHTAEQALVKLNGTDGTVLWRFDNGNFDFDANLEGYQIFPQIFSLLGNDVVVAGPFSGALAGHDFVKLSGLDGSVQWTSDVFAGDYVTGFHVEGDGDLIATGGNRWAKLDADSGATLWTNARPPFLCSFGCNGYGKLGMPNGDIYYVGESEDQPFVELLPAFAGSSQKHWRPPNDANLHSSVLRATADSSGHIWLRLSRHFRHGSAWINFLTEFDPNSGALLGQQALVGFPSSNVAQYVAQQFLAAPEDNRLPVMTFVQEAPAPSTSGNALIDTTVHATGDISIQTTVDRTEARLGDTVGFHIFAKYAGNNPLAGAHAIADFSQAGDLSNLSCITQSASNCVLDSRFGGVITVSFDVQPGGQIEIAGQVHVTVSSATVLAQSLAYGPVGLSEQDTLNNFSQIGFGDEIFKDGF